MQKFYRYGSLPVTLILCLMIGLNAILAQTSKDPAGINLGTEFGRVSDPKIEMDEGNELIAVRRTVLLFEDLGQKNRQKEFVEIQLKAKHLLPAMNCCEPYAFIDGKSFVVYRAGKYLLIRIEKADFEKLKNRSLIFMAYIPTAMVQFLAERSANNDFRDIAGEKFGKLKKKDSKRFPVIRETQDEFHKRIRRITLGN